MALPRSLLDDRAAGALLGGALGDALGMPTQTLSPEAIRAAFGRVEGFVAADPDHPVSHGLSAGTVTDDTEQTLLLARILLDSPGRLDQRRWTAALDAWERDVVARGGADLLGPSTRRAIDAVRRGEPPERAGAGGDTNGAAMRVAPVGIATPAEPLDRLIDAVADASLATHGTGVAIAGASAVAAAVSLGVGGGGWSEACAFAVRAAREGARRGRWTAGADCAARIELALGLVREGTADEESAHASKATARRLARLVGTSVATQESVPCAFGALALAGGDPWRAGLVAANLGGDTDTIGAIAGAVGGACAGAAALPAEAVRALRGIEPDRVEGIARRLVERRLGGPA